VGLDGDGGEGADGVSHVSGARRRCTAGDGGHQPEEALEEGGGVSYREEALVVWWTACGDWHIGAD